MIVRRYDRPCLRRRAIAPPCRVSEGVPQTPLSHSVESSMRLLTRGITAAVLLVTSMTAIPSTSGSAHASPAPSPGPTRATPAPLYRSARAVPGEYIVTVQRNLDPAAMVKRFGVKPLFTYTKVMRGFAAQLNAAQLEMVRGTAGIQAVEQNATVSADDLGGGRTPREVAASWGLDRIDQRALPLDHQFTTVGKGQGTTAYILDTGIDYSHSQFGGRAVFGFDAIGDGRNGQDCEGHGTHVAGTVGGATYGVAPQTTLVSVRVLGCDGSGSWAGVVAGFDWVANNAKQPAVLNASLGGSYSPVVNQAATALSDSGVLPVVAAGNSSADACNYSPASAENVTAVGATDQSDSQTSFSNFGQCVSLYAPGKGIVSAKLGGGSIAMDGTSMASPHVAGVALLYKAQHPTASSTEVNNWLDTVATQNTLKVTQGSPNRLLFTDGL